METSPLNVGDLVQLSDFFGVVIKIENGRITVDGERVSQHIKHYTVTWFNTELSFTYPHSDINDVIFKV
jgi:hypothetical protein